MLDFIPDLVKGLFAEGNKRRLRRNYIRMLIAETMNNISILVANKSYIQFSKQFSGINIEAFNKFDVRFEELFSICDENISMYTNYRNEIKKFSKIDERPIRISDDEFDKIYAELIGFKEFLLKAKEKDYNFNFKNFIPKEILHQKFKPDLGMYYFKNKKRIKNHIFIPFVIFHIARVNKNLYTTMSHIELDKTYAVSLDFDSKKLFELLNFYKVEVREKLKSNLLGDFKNPIHINLDKIEVGVKCKLGKVTKGRTEEFVPFNVKHFINVGN